jgi:prepilin-type processing-associated H-X9-DG protein
VRALIAAEKPYTGPGRPFGGLHPNGLNVLFADASARFLRDVPEPPTLEILVPFSVSAVASD